MKRKTKQNKSKVKSQPKILMKIPLLFSFYCCLFACLFVVCCCNAFNFRFIRWKPVITTISFLCPLVPSPPHCILHTSLSIVKHIIQHPCDYLGSFWIERAPRTINFSVESLHFDSPKNKTFSHNKNPGHLSVLFVSLCLLDSPVQITTPVSMYVWFEFCIVDLTN